MRRVCHFSEKKAGFLCMLRRQTPCGSAGTSHLSHQTISPPYTSPSFLLRVTSEKKYQARNSQGNRENNRCLGNDEAVWVQQKESLVRRQSLMAVPKTKEKMNSSRFTCRFTYDVTAHLGNAVTRFRYIHRRQEYISTRGTGSDRLRLHLPPDATLSLVGALDPSTP